MRILLVTPTAAPGVPGNRVTADRWGAFLRELGHEVEVRTAREAEAGSTAGSSGSPPARPDVLVALHARKSGEAALRFDRERRRADGGGALVVALTGTDLYRDLQDPDSPAWEPVRRADRLVVLQERGPEALPEEHRSKTRVIYQSVPELWEDDDGGCGRGSGFGLDRSTSERTGPLRVCVLAHLRPVKDPLLAAEASRLLPEATRLRIDHFGSAYSGEMADRARAESRAGSAYRWHGEVPRPEGLRELAASDLLLLTSRLEGAGNAASEAITARVPVLCTRVPGLVGMVGEGYPGLFEVGDAPGLARLLQRAADEPDYLALLGEAIEARRPLLDPARERQGWADLLRELEPRE